jgi:hypothetical protein
VSIRARFERFPATVKGAFVVRGEDPNPHQVVFRGGRVVPVGQGLEHPLPMKAVVVHCPPHQDMFLPFEFSTTDLGPGWYGLECDVDIDGVARSVPGGRRFVVPWPRATVRRGPVPIAGELTLGRTVVTLDQADCSGDHVLLHYRTDPARRVSFNLFADGEPLAEIEAELDLETGSGSVKTYPLLRSHERLRIDASVRGGRDSMEIGLG